MTMFSSAIRPLLQQRTIPSCLHQRYASSASRAVRHSPKQIAESLPRTAVPKPVVPPPRTQPVQPLNAARSKMPAPDPQFSVLFKELGPEVAKKQWYAQKLYDSGRTMIYRPPSQFGIYAASFCMGGGALGIALVLAYGNLWAFTGGDPDLPWIVPVAHRLGIMVFAAMGFIAIYRSFNFVKAIDLVSVDGMVKLAVQVRHGVPFLPPRRYVLAPYELRMDQQFVQQLEYPEWMQDDEDVPQPATRKRGPLTNIARYISQAFYYPFASTRRLITLEGFMSIRLEENGKKKKLDTQGYFSNGAKDLVEMGVIY